MATRRRRAKSQKNNDLKVQSNDADHCDQHIVVKEEPDSSEHESSRDITKKHTRKTASASDGSGSNRSSPHMPMSLDVLAQVATATLENEPSASDSEPTPQKKLSKRSVQSLDVLTLEQIKMLSDKALVNMFSEMSANEMTRNYTFTCHLIPSQCAENYTSFGNENRARLRMRSHLLAHVSELLKEANGHEGKLQKFTAEPVHARRKRLAAEKAAQKRARKRQREASQASKVTSHKTPKRETFTGLRPAGTSRHKDSSPGRSNSSGDYLGNISPGSSKRKQDLSLVKIEGSDDVSPRKRNKKSPSPSKGKSPGENNNGIGDYLLSGPGLEGEVVSEIEISQAETSNADDAHMREDAERCIEENEQFILELLSRAQPYHDHCYTSIFGKRRGIEQMTVDSDEEGTDDWSCRTAARRLKITSEPSLCPADAAKTVTLKVNAGSVSTTNNVHIPIIRLARIPVAPDGTPLVSAEEVVVQDQPDPEPESDVAEDDSSRKRNLAGLRPYPPMPKSELARKGKVNVPEEEITDSDIEEHPHGHKFRVSPKGLEGTAEWERKTALKCIRELRLRCKRKEETSLMCKICKDKAFTAAATLMYHYRSHAGIKPFVCLICNTTFTRQHSLNYHMLIHNNQSRFTCKDCGRKFRHPSHFKEHLRRHTGETPFHCTDCPLRFKTRNTYKRHLKTRHGKLLTATGIRVMPHDEFLKVRTKPYKKGEDGSEEDDYDDDLDDEEEEDEDDDYGDEDEESLGSLAADEAELELAIPDNKLLQFCTQVVSQEVG